MSDVFVCPECGHEHSISDLELWEVYDEDGKQTDFNCSKCETELLINSRITGWEFDVEKAD